VPVLPDGAGSPSKIRRCNPWVNQCPTLRNREAGSNLADLGRSAVHENAAVMCGFSTPKPASSLGEEVTVKVCGVAVTMLPE
jgi:hypothetical protein